MMSVPADDSANSTCQPPTFLSSADESLWSAQTDYFCRGFQAGSRARDRVRGAKLRHPILNEH